MHAFVYLFRKLFPFLVIVYLPLEMRARGMWHLAVIVKTNNSSTVILHNIRKIVNAKSKKGKKKHAIFEKSINAVKTLPKIGQFSISNI